ncbi:MAG: septum formation initiator family protein [Terracidiphilus sp.]|jgi:cell division protein FtsB
MPDEKVRASAASSATGSGEQTAPLPLPKRALEFALRAWRPAATVVAVMLALLLGWHVVNGRHGLSVWQQKRTEDRQLRKEIDDLQQENGLLRQRVERLKSDPDAISHEAREKLHYAKPNEVIVTLPPDPQPQTAAAAK